MQKTMHATTTQSGSGESTSSGRKRNREEKNSKSSSKNNDTRRNQKLLFALEKSTTHNIDPKGQQLHYRSFYGFAQNAGFMVERLLGENIKKLKYPLEARNLASDELHQKTHNEEDANVHDALKLLMQIADTEVAKVDAHPIPPPFKYRKTSDTTTTTTTTTLQHSLYEIIGEGSSSQEANEEVKDEVVATEIVELDLFSDCASVKEEKYNGLPCLRSLEVKSQNTSAVLVTTGFQLQKWGQIDLTDNYFNCLRCILCFLEEHPVFQGTFSSFESFSQVKIAEAQIQAEPALRDNLNVEVELINKRLTTLRSELVILAEESGSSTQMTNVAFQACESAQRSLQAFQRDMVGKLFFSLFYILFNCLIECAG